ncbi:hypothetical protein PHYSODRAFT_341515, partial [Phytophthora sojae]
VEASANANERTSGNAKQNGSAGVSGNVTANVEADAPATPKSDASSRARAAAAAAAEGVAANEACAAALSEAAVSATTRVTENPNDSTRRVEVAENPTRTRQRTKSEQDGSPKDLLEGKRQSSSPPSKPTSPPGHQSSTQLEQEQEPRMAQGLLLTFESPDQVSGVDLPAYTRYDAGETISKLVAHPPRQLSAPTRVSKHPTPSHSAFVALSDGQVALLLQLGDASAETMGLGAACSSTLLRRPPHGQPPSSILRRARCGAKFAGLCPRHLGLGGHTESQRVDAPKVVLQRDVQVLGRLDLHAALRKRRTGRAELFVDRGALLLQSGQGLTSLISLGDGSVSPLLKGGHGLTCPVPLGDSSVSLASQGRGGATHLISHVEGPVTRLLDDHENAGHAVTLGESGVALLLGSGHELPHVISFSFGGGHSRLDRSEGSLGGCEVDAKVVTLGALALCSKLPR